MGILILDHVHIRTTNLDQLRDFYVQVLKFHSKSKTGRRRGCWLSINKNTFLHLIEVEKIDQISHPRIEHFAFRAEGLREMMDRLDMFGYAYNLNPLKEQDVVQLNLRDPDDNRLHLDFPIVEFESRMAPKRLSRR